MSKFEKIDYSKRKTLSNLGEGYSIHLKNKVTVLGLNEKTFKKGDIITIEKITLKNDKPHHIVISISRDGEKNKKIEMSGGVFLSNFINQIDKNDIILKNQDKNKDKVNEIINKKD